LRHSTACIARGVLAVPLDAYGTAEFAARVASDVQPKLAVGDALLLHQLPSEYSRLTFEDWLSALPAEEAGPVAGLSRETPLQILFYFRHHRRSQGRGADSWKYFGHVEPISAEREPYMRWERLLVHPLRIFDTLPLSHVFWADDGALGSPPFLLPRFTSRGRLGGLATDRKPSSVSASAYWPRCRA